MAQVEFFNSLTSSPMHDSVHDHDEGAAADQKEKEQIDTDDRSPLHLVWAIRDCTDLLFYIEYVHYLVESQRRLSKMIVFIDVYLTGLGSSCDPAFLLTQTLFYLLVGKKAGKYLRVNYSRPDMVSCINAVSPGAVYYCGGSGLKDITASACRDAKVPFFAESFDYSGRIGMWLQRQWQKRYSAQARDRRRDRRDNEGNETGNGSRMTTLDRNV